MKKMEQRYFEESIVYRKYDWANVKNYKCLNIVLFRSKMHYFGFSWCLNYSNPK